MNGRLRHAVAQHDDVDNTHEDHGNGHSQRKTPFIVNPVEVDSSERDSLPEPLRGYHRITS